MRSMERRFGVRELPETAQAKFQQSKQKLEESIEDWADRALTLATRALVNCRMHICIDKQLPMYAKDCWTKKQASMLRMHVQRLWRQPLIAYAGFNTTIRRYMAGPQGVKCGMSVLNRIQNQARYQYGLHQPSNFRKIQPQYPCEQINQLRGWNRRIPQANQIAPCGREAVEKWKIP